MGVIEGGMPHAMLMFRDMFKTNIKNKKINIGFS
jgi:hypothetical protein